MITSLDNPLYHAYSYAVHYRMFLTDSMSDAEKLLKNVDHQKVMTCRRVDSNGVVSSNREKISSDDSISDKFQYYDVIDSRVDADYMITRYEFKTYMDVQPGTDSLSHGTTLEQKLLIHEAYSGNLLLLMNNVTQLKGSQSVYIVIKPFFVLANDGGGDYPSKYSEVHEGLGTILQITSITADYGTQGTNYEFSGVTLKDGAANLPTVSTDLISQVKFPVPKNSDMKTVMQAFQDKLYLTAVNRVTKDTNKNKFKRYQFKIILSDDYSTSDYKFDNYTLFSTTSGNNDPTLSFQDMTVPDALMKILGGSTTIHNDATKSTTKITSDKIKDNDGNEIVFYKKFRPYITSTISKDTDDTTNLEIVTYKINRQAFFTTNEGSNGFDIKDDYATIQAFEDMMFGDNNKKKNGKTNEKLHNVVVYDYLFTGKNTDVLDFKLALLNGLIVPYLKENQLQAVGSYDPNNISLTVKDTTPPFTRISQAPISVPSKPNLKDKNPAKKSQYYDVLNRISFVESLQFKMTVVGNPLLLSTFMSSDYDAPSNIFKRDVLPCLFFLNIKYPKQSNFWSYETNNTTPELEPFWYRGLMRMLVVETVLEGNSFYHNIEARPFISESQPDAQQAIDSNKPDQSAPIKPIVVNVAAAGIYKSQLDQNKKNETINTIGGRPQLEGTISTSTGTNRIAQGIATKLPAPFTGFKVATGTPVANVTITSSYGVWRKNNTRLGGRYHLGTDIKGGVGTPVFACFSGTIQNEYSSSVGQMITITNAQGLGVRFLHVKPDPDLGTTIKQVTAGMKIGTIGPWDDGPHVHMELIYKGLIYNAEQVLNNPKFKSGQPDVIQSF